MLGDTLTAERDGLPDRRVKLGRKFLRRGWQRHVPRAHASQVAVDRHRAAQHAEVREDGPGQAAPRRCILRVGPRGFAPGVHGPLVIEVVDLLGTLCAERIRGRIGPHIGDERHQRDGQEQRRPRNPLHPWILNAACVSCAGSGLRLQSAV